VFGFWKFPCIEYGWCTYKGGNISGPEGVEREINAVRTKRELSGNKVEYCVADSIKGTYTGSIES
jgi:hypothetical protein